MGTSPHLRNVTPPTLRMCSHLPTAAASTFARLTGTRTLPAREQLTGPRNLDLMPPYEGTRYRHQALPPRAPDSCAHVEGDSDVRAAEERRGSRGSGRPGDGQLRGVQAAPDRGAAFQRAGMRDTDSCQRLLLAPRGF